MRRDTRFIAGQYLFTLEVTAVGYRVEFINRHRVLRRNGHRRQSAVVVEPVRDFVRHNQVIIGFNCRLHVVTDNARATGP
jgi:hypothetical protein